MRRPRRGSDAQRRNAESAREAAYFKRLLPRFARHPVIGELQGVGLKRFRNGSRASAMSITCSERPQTSSEKNPGAF